MAELSEHARQMWAADAASQALGMALVEVSEGVAVVEMTVRADMLNGHGIGHGGLTFTLADTAFAFACNSYGPVSVAHSAQIRFRGPVYEGDRLIATAEEVNRNGRRGVYAVTVRRGDDIIAEFSGHSTTLPNPPD